MEITGSPVGIFPPFTVSIVEKGIIWGSKRAYRLSTRMIRRVVSIMSKMAEPTLILGVVRIIVSPLFR
ncbi:hypothetical protein [Methanoregula sp.]|uniref:hypothetical protein n=1 Tax=Methanoregula sp. TaxID=2052170 RepID=UPI003D0DB344